MAHLFSLSIDSDIIELIQMVSKISVIDNKPIEVITTQEYIAKIVDWTY